MSSSVFMQQLLFPWASPRPARKPFGRRDRQRVIRQASEWARSKETLAEFDEAAIHQALAAVLAAIAEIEVQRVLDALDESSAEVVNEIATR